MYNNYTLLLIIYYIVPFLKDNLFYFAAAGNGLRKKLVRFMLTEIPFVYHCNDSLQCPNWFGFTKCENNMCMCDEDYYQVFNKTSETAHCRLCSCELRFNQDTLNIRIDLNIICTFIHLFKKNGVFYLCSCELKLL